MRLAGEAGQRRRLARGEPPRQPANERVRRARIALDERGFPRTHEPRRAHGVVLESLYRHRRHGRQWPRCYNPAACLV